MTTTLLFVHAFLITFAATLVILNAILYRRLRLLDELLARICVEAWMMRRWPLIEQYLDFVGMQLRLVVEKRQ